MQTTKILTLFALVLMVAGFTATVQAVDVCVLEDTQIGGRINNPPEAIYFMPYSQISDEARYAGYAPEIYAAVKSFPEGTPLKAKIVLGRATAYYGEQEKYSLYKIIERYDFMSRSEDIVLSEKVAEGVIDGSTTIEFDATDLINDWGQNPVENFGFAVIQDTGSAILIATADYPENGAAVKPHIIIEEDLPPAPRIEDVNRDGKINYWDQIPIIQILFPNYDLGFPIPPEYDNIDSANCDVNQDGCTNLSDLIQIGQNCDNPDCSV